MRSLRSVLNYEPRELKFGTSGRRGRVVDLTQLEVYLNALAELEYLQTLPAEGGGIAPGDEFYFAYDLRPSSWRIVAWQEGRGELAQAVECAIRDAGMRPVNLGRIPTPALACYAISRGRGSMMVTGSHIPFDRNGYKTNTSRGELLKEHEAPVNERVRAVRERLYNQPAGESPFDQRGMFKHGPRELPPENAAGRDEYAARYADFFGDLSLRGTNLLVYQHSAVGRDLLVEVLARLGATVTAAGRSDTFVPIDTENIGEEQLASMQRLVDEARAEGVRIDAVVSTDGDSDRPLILDCDSATGRVRFYGGDLVGMIAAEFLGADAVVVPVSCNDAIDRGPLARVLEPRTRIGSPYVIAGMEAARRKGRRAVCGWEANGGFLTGSDIERGGRTLRALPTRDAFLPILCTLFAARRRRAPLSALFAALPARFSRAALLRDFPRETGLKIVERFTPSLDRDPAAVMEELAAFFGPEHGFFFPITALDCTDGVRICFANGEVAHIRPSGNADEMRIYAVADTQERAAAIAAAGVGEPNGILRRLQRLVDG